MILIPIGIRWPAVATEGFLVVLQELEVPVELKNVSIIKAKTDIVEELLDAVALVVIVVCKITELHESFVVRHSRISGRNIIVGRRIVGGRRFVVGRSIVGIVIVGHSFANGFHELLSTDGTDVELEHFLKRIFMLFIRHGRWLMIICSKSEGRRAMVSNWSMKRGTSELKSKL
jgi:hypothetical protein